MSRTRKEHLPIIDVKNRRALISSGDRSIALGARYLNAPFFIGMTLEEAVAKAEREFDSPYWK